MKFLDETVIEVFAGNGGKGCVSFRREKYVPRGGPNGGDGGRGGHIILISDKGLSTLLDISYRRTFRAGHGEFGKGKQMNGKNGEDRVIRVPVGTVVFDADSGEELADLSEDGIEWIVAKGGKGGRGNMHYATATRQAPRFAQPGLPGEEKKIRLELKLLADVGLVGMPNAGKSTLISVISNARPKIADYPFTTKVPNLGLVRVDEDRSFVVADIPGLIEGAHEGHGMGIQFLRHIERTRVILHLIDPTNPSCPDPLKQYKSIRKELSSYSGEIAERPEIVVLTKADIPEAKEIAEKFEAKIKKASKSKVMIISSATREGVKDLVSSVGKLVFARK